MTFSTPVTENIAKGGGARLAALEWIDENFGREFRQGGNKAAEAYYTHESNAAKTGAKHSQTNSSPTSMKPR